MSQWGPCKARDLFRALLRAGWSLKREANGSHCIPDAPAVPISGLPSTTGKGSARERLPGSQNPPG